MNTAHLGVLIGRFQPFHLGHAYLIEAALSQCDTLLVIIGSSFRARNIKNPFHFEERKLLIQQSFPQSNLHFAAIPDFFYSETAWVNAVRHVVNALSPQRVTLFGHTKDASTYYLKEFPEWNEVEFPNFQDIHATEIRNQYFCNEEISPHVAPPTRDFLFKFKTTPDFGRLQEEARFVAGYRESWSKSPYAPIFVTADALVVCDEHLLLIQRKYCPGKGLYALPGGFLEEDEWIRAGICRELIEETGIGLDKNTLLQRLLTIQVFDYPDRSLIGRVITHAGYFELALPRPPVTAADDALSVEWVPLTHLKNLKEQFHDDHYQIITTLLDPARL